MLLLLNKTTTETWFLFFIQWLSIRKVFFVRLIKNNTRHEKSIYSKKGSCPPVQAKDTHCMVLLTSLTTSNSIWFRCVTISCFPLGKKHELLLIIPRNVDISFSFHCSHFLCKETWEYSRSFTRSSNDLVIHCWVDRHLLIKYYKWV